MDTLDRELMTPEHVHGARTAADYRRLQRDYITRGRRARPRMAWRDPWVSVDKPTVLVSGGKWVVKCACGNAPSVHPDWQLACCFECGAIYEALTMPSEAPAVAALLSARAHHSLRHWQPAETVDDLAAENAVLSEKGLSR